MASVKVKFRPSIIEGKTGTLYLQVIHRRIVRSQKTKYKVYPDEWNARTARITPSPSRPDRHSILSRYRHEIKQDLFRLNECIANLTRKGQPYSTDELLRFYRKRCENDTLTGFMTSLIRHLKEQGRIRTGETYQCTLNSFMRFKNGEEIILDEMNQETIEAYEAYLKKGRLSLNTISFYMRILRAVYNRAVEKELTTQRFPFRHVYTGIEKTIKRAIPQPIIRQIKDKGTPDRKFGRLRPRHVPFQFLHARHVFCRHGISEKKGFAQRHTDLSQKKDRTATFHQMGTMHAGDYRKIPS